MEFPDEVLPMSNIENNFFFKNIIIFRILSSIFYNFRFNLLSSSLWWFFDGKRQKVFWDLRKKVNSMTRIGKLVVSDKNKYNQSRLIKFSILIYLLSLSLYAF